MESASTPDPATESLDVYSARDGESGDVWTREHGVIRVPKGWAFLPTGDPYVTRKVKELGPVWVLRKPDSRRRITRTLGLYATAKNIREAKFKAKETEATRKKQRGLGAKSRARQEGKYRAEFRQAVLDFLDFEPKHAELAASIADGAVEQACPVGSGTVARTKTLSLEEKVRLAVVAYVRHRHTAYEEELGLSEWDGEGYREVKALANREANDFIEKHRRQRMEERGNEGCRPS